MRGSLTSFRFVCFVLLAPTLLWNTGCSTTASSGHSPNITLEAPAAFGTEVTKKSYHKGEDLLQDDIYHLLPIAPMSEYHGWFGSRKVSQADMHAWMVHVYSCYSRKIAAAYRSAGDGFQADLNEGPEFLRSGDRSYMFARFERKQFPWGNAVSFFSQFTQDTALYVPHNGHLTYEIWGVTADHKYSVVATLSVSHPKLANWGPEVRASRSVEKLKQDRDFRLVESCSPDDFTPSLTAFDRLVGSLRIQ